jgi:hypothetical protein
MFMPLDGDPETKHPEMKVPAFEVDLARQSCVTYIAGAQRADLNVSGI